MCRLCQRERKLCDSHVIPEFLFVPTYDGDGRALEISDGGKRNKFVQKGRTEKLLCLECESFLNTNFEDYFAKLWYEPGMLPATPTLPVIQLSGLDYTRFKLFHLSILWRSSVARSKPFAQTSLGPYEQHIRTMLLARDPGDSSRHQIFGTALTLTPPGSINHAMVMPYIPFFAQGVRAYLGIYGGCAWEIIVAKQPVRGDLEHRMLLENGSIQLFVGDMAAIAPLKKQFATYYETARKGGWKLPWAGA